MNYQFSNLLGAPYRGGTLLIHDNELLTPVGNRVGQVGVWTGLPPMAGWAAAGGGCSAGHLSAAADAERTNERTLHYTCCAAAGQPHGVHQQVPPVREPDPGGGGLEPPAVAAGSGACTSSVPGAQVRAA